MSRSKRKPYITCCEGSNKKDKIAANRIFRRINKIFLKKDPDKVKYRLREVSDTYSFATDGLAYYVQKHIKDDPWWGDFYIRIQRK